MSNPWERGLAVLSTDTPRLLPLLRQRLIGSMPSTSTMRHVTSDDEEPLTELQMSTRWRVMLQASGWTVQENDTDERVRCVDVYMLTIANRARKHRLLDCYGVEMIQTHKQVLYRGLQWLCSKAVQLQLASEVPPLQSHRMPFAAPPTGTSGPFLPAWRPHLHPTAWLYTPRHLCGQRPRRPL